MAQTRVLSPVAHHGRAPIGLLEGADVSDAEVRAYAWLTTWDFGRTGRMFTGRDEMAEALHWSVPKLDRALRALEQRGAIRRIRRGLGMCNDIELLAELDPVEPRVASPDDPESSLAMSLSDRERRLPIQERTQERTQDAAPAASSRKKTDQRAQVVANAWWLEQNPRPLQKFIAVVGMVNTALKAGHSEDAILAALRKIGNDPPIVLWKLEKALKSGRSSHDPHGLNWHLAAGE